MEHATNNPRANVAVVGMGYWGKNLVRNFFELGALSTVCDANPDVALHGQDQFRNVRFCREYEDVLSDPAVVAVALATPAVTHYEMARAALEAGKDVFVEKPLAIQVQQGRELVRLAESLGRILMVGHILRYHRAILKLQELIRSGALGKIQCLYSNRLNIGKIRTEENILWSFAPHDISVMLALLDEVPNSVSSQGGAYLNHDVFDVTLSQFEFPSGVHAHIFVSWLHPFKEQRLVVVGSDKMAVFDDTAENKLVLYPHKVEWRNRVPTAIKANGEVVPLPDREPLRDECQQFLDSIASRVAPVTDGREGLRVLTVLDACERSLLRGGEVVSTTQENRKALTPDYFVHETACVDEGADIGAGTKIWHFSHVMKGARIGERCNLGQNVNVDGRTVIGNNVKIQNNVSVYAGVVIENDVFLGPSCVLTNISNPRSELNRHAQYETTTLRQGCTIGANATIVCGVTVGRYAFVGAGSVVTKDVPDYALVMGSPARQAGWMSRHGHRLGPADSDGVMRCPEHGYRYKEVSPGVLRCLDLDETAPLPPEASRSDRTYKELKHTAIPLVNPRAAKPMKIPLLDLGAQYAAIKEEVNRAISEVVESQHFILGPQVQQCEKAIAEYSHCAHGIGVSSGTDALLICLMSEGIGPGDEVITTPYTFFATAGAIARVGATPVFVDIDPVTYNLNVALIESKITTRTRAIIPVHLYGQMAEMDQLMPLAEKHKLVVIEDAAQAIGAEHHGKRAGSWGHYGCFSFFPSKNLGAAGDGGMVVTNDAARAEKLMRLRAHGSKPKYHHKIIGGNFRLDTLQAAVVLAKLRHLDDWTAARQRNAARYDRLFQESGLRVADSSCAPGQNGACGEPEICLPKVASGRHIFNQYVVRVARRDALKAFLESKGVATEVYYPVPMHLQECFANLGYVAGAFPESESAAKETLALPVYPEVTDEQARYVVECVAQAITHERPIRNQVDGESAALRIPFVPSGNNDEGPFLRPVSEHGSVPDHEPVRAH